MQKRVLDQEHPDTAGATVNLTNALSTQGQFVEAVAPYRETLEVQERVLGQEHPDTLRTARNLALAPKFPAPHDNLRNK